jgi:hypothetical protein
LAARFVSSKIPPALIVQKLKLLARDDGVRVRRDDHDGAAAKILRAQDRSIPAVVPLAF